MKSLTKLATALSAMGMLATMAPANAIPSLTFTSPNASYGTQVVDPFTGFDWVGTASAVTSGFNPDGSTVFTTTYLSSAIGIFTAGGETALVNGLTPNGSPDSRWEFTIKATIFETATCANVDCSQVNFQTVGGSWDVYFDPSADANRLLGTGFLDGTRILGGTMNSGYAGQFTGDGISGTGDFDFSGAVTFTETNSTKDAYINPELVSTIAGANLRLGSRVTGGWIAPTEWVDGGGIPEGSIIFQADGQQGFSLVPEPGTVALLGLGLMGLGFTSRRRKG